MGTILSIIALAAILRGVFYLVELAFFDWIRKEARSKESRFVIMPKEKRIIQRLDGDTFDKFFYNATDECFECQTRSHRIYATEREKWEIIKGDHNIANEMNWWQKYIYKNTGAWWFQKLNMKSSVSERIVDVGKYIAPNKAEDEAKIEKLKDNKTIYLFRTWEEYSFKITGAEDITGNPVTVFVTLLGRVQNPYIAEVETQNWDTLFGAKVRDASIPIIYESYFYKEAPIAPEKAKNLDPEKLEKKRNESKDEISEKIKEVLKAIFVGNDKHIQNGGFSFDEVLIQDIVMENKDIITAIAKTVVSEEEKKQAFNKAEGEAALKGKVGDEETRIRRERLKDMGENLDAARLIAMENAFNGAEAISLGNGAGMFFNYPVKNEGKRRQHKHAAAKQTPDKSQTTQTQDDDEQED